MARKMISNAQVLINDVAIGYVPNSLKVKLGYGEDNYISQTGGGDIVIPIYSKNAETRVAEVSFDLSPYDVDIALFRSIKNRENNNVIVIADNSSNFSLTFQEAALINDPDIEFSATGKFTVNFKSRPAI